MLCFSRRRAPATLIFFFAAAIALRARTFAAPFTEEFSRQTWRSENGLPQNTVQAIVQSRDGYLWVGTQGGLARFDGVRFIVFNAQNTPELRSNNIRKLAETADGSLWIAASKGVTRLQHGRFSIVGTFPASSARPLLSDAARRYIANVFAGETILAIAQDREGDVWIGTESGGLSILRRKKFTTLTRRDGLPDDSIRCVLEDRNGAVWIGTDGHGLARYQDGKFSTLTTRDGLSSNVILALAEDSNGDLLAGTPDGLNRIGNGSVSAITSAEGLPDDFVRSIVCGSDGSLWIGTRRGLAHREGSHFKTYSQSDGLGSDLVGAMLPDGGSGLWIATLHGLSHLSGGRFTNYTIENGLSSDVITALWRDGNNILWIGTQTGGLNALLDGRFIHFPSSLGLPDTIYGLAEDNDRDLWISSNAGIFRANRQELIAFARGHGTEVTVSSYDASDGLEISESGGGGHPAIWKAKDGALWFATLKGAAVIRSPHDQLNRVPPQVAIESVAIDGQTMNPADLRSIHPGHAEFSFEYAGLSFVAPQKVRFRYKLEGFDRAWVHAGTRRAAYYTNLRPGAYVFHVQARNNDGIWSERSASMSFRLEPHFYQTYSFYALILAGLAFLAWCVYRWRVRQVEARFGIVLEERNRIAREIHDTLAQGLVGISVQLELVSRLLTASADAAKEHLDQARVLVRNSLSEARRAIWDLRSQSAEHQDFAARISNMASQVANPGRAKVKLQVRGVYRPVAPKIEEELLKIAHEAITNCIRHADAGRIDIELEFDAKKLRMTIADDGCGFTHSINSFGENGHFGLRGMKERAQAIHAELKVESAAGKGTKISVEAPVGPAGLGTGARMD